MKGMMNGKIRELADQPEVMELIEYIRKLEAENKLKDVQMEIKEEKIRDLRQLAANQDAEITELRRRNVNISEVLDDVLESQDVCRQALEKLRDAINGMDK